MMVSIKGGSQPGHILREAAKRKDEQYRDKLYKVLKPELQKALNEFYEYQANSIKKFHETAVDNFYDDYTPLRYKRTGSLYDLIEVNNEKEYIQWNYDGSRMVSAERSKESTNKIFVSYDEDVTSGGNSLFELVFINGYHGGAYGTDSNGDTVYSPHYRAGPHFQTWGGEAHQSSSPIKSVYDAINEADSDGGEFQRVFTNAVVNAFYSAKAKIKS